MEIPVVDLGQLTQRAAVPTLTITFLPYDLVFYKVIPRLLCCCQAQDDIWLLLLKWGKRFFSDFVLMLVGARNFSPVTTKFPQKIIEH